MKEKPLKVVYLISILILYCSLISGCTSSFGPKISIENAWGRSSPKVATSGAFYMLIKNTGGEADKLISGKSLACEVVELHESYKTDQGIMGMRPVEGGIIEVPAESQVELKVGGMHVMCINKLEEFNAGGILPLTLNFEKSGQIIIEVEIREPY